MSAIVEEVLKTHFWVSPSTHHCNCDGRHVPPEQFVKHCIEAALALAELENRRDVEQIDHDLNIYRGVLGLGRWQIMQKIDDLLEQRTVAVIAQ